MALDVEMLYVADTRITCLRKIDLEHKQVVTVRGRRHARLDMARRRKSWFGQALSETALNSP